jgi:hypothetical protein
MNLWVVWSGDDGSENVFGVYSSEEKAIAAADADGIFGDVTEMIELDAPPESEYQRQERLKP